MAALIGRHTARQICAALGIESSGLRRLELIADKDAVTTVRTDRIVYDDQLERLVALLTEYRVEAVDSWREPIGGDPYNHTGSNAGRKD